MAYDLVGCMRGRGREAVRGQSTLVSENSLAAHLEVGIVFLVR